jgi:hypothetical protein
VIASEAKSLLFRLRDSRREAGATSNKANSDAALVMASE